jgi:1,2-phenylacetyl-CoA epoxidase catalytic subunit
MPSTRVYLDTSVYNRPFDDQAQPRIWLETLAVSIILQMLEEGAAELVSSAVVAYEISRNPDEMRRRWVQQIVEKESLIQHMNNDIKQRAQ